MKDVFIKFRVKCSICNLRLKTFWYKITVPFQIAIKCIKRYWDLLKIDKESKDRWERHVKISKLKSKDELELKREQFYLLKTQFIGAFFRTSICAGSCIELKEDPNEFDNSQKEFQKNKEELVSLLEKISNYEEITFDENIKNGIIAWEIEKFETQEELTSWLKSFSNNIYNLDII